MNEAPAPLVLDRARTAAGLRTAPLLDALRHALVAISTGTASAPARIAAYTERGLLGAMPAYVPGLGLAAKLVSVYPSAGPGRSAHQGIVALFDEHDGTLAAVLDAEPITAVRTAATATLAMQALARPDAERVAVLGAGTQARAQLALLAELLPAARVRVAARDPQRARAAAEHFPGATAVSSVAAALDGAEVVFCCTDTQAPLVAAGDLAPGTHLSSVGGSRGPEFDPRLLAGASAFVEWPGAASERPPAGAHELQGVAAEALTLLGAVLAGQAPGRRSRDEITIFKSTGHGALDVAAARVVLDHIEADAVRE